MWGNWFSINFRLSALVEFVYIYDSEPLSSHNLKIFSAHIRISFLGCIPIFTEDIFTVQHDALALLWFKCNPHPIPIYLVAAVVFPPPLALFAYKWPLPKRFSSRKTPLCSQCLSVYCVFGRLEIQSLLYGSSSLYPNFRVELNNGPNIHTDMDLACWWLISWQND